MKEDIFTSYEYEQMARLLSGEMNEAEEQGFREKLMADPGKLKAFEETEKNWTNMSGLGNFDGLNSSAAWQKLEKRIAHDSSVNENKNITIPLWFKWAASWLLLITFGVSIWLITQDSALEEGLYTLVTYDENQTHVHTLHDGSVVYLGNNTTFSYPESFEHTKRIVKLQGEAFIDVAHNPVSPFLLETQHAIIEVLGTSFNVKTFEDDSMELFVETGRVKVQLKADDHKPTVVDHGELLIIRENKVVKLTSPDYYNTAWRKHHMHFKDEKLKNIISVLNQNYPVVFDIAEESLEERRLTIAFHDTSVSTMSELISKSLNIDFEMKEESNILFKSKN